MQLNSLLQGRCIYTYINFIINFIKLLQLYISSDSLIFVDVIWMRISEYFLCIFLELMSTSLYSQMH